MALPKHVQSALRKYAFLTDNPTGAGLPKSVTAPKPAAPMPKGLTEQAQSFSFNKPGGGAKPLMPPQPKPTGLASASIGAAPAGNNSIFSRQTPAAPAAQPTTAQLRAQQNAASVAAAQSGQPAQPALATNRQQVDPQTFAQMRAQQSQTTPGPKSHTGYGSYVDVLDRWYNPWTTQTSTERGEESLKGWGQTAMGIAGGATATAAAVPVAAAAGLTAAGGGAMTAGGTAATLGTEAALPAALEGVRQLSGGTETAPTPAPEQGAPQQTAATQQQPGAQPTQNTPTDGAAKPATPMTPDQKQQANTDVMAKLNSDMPDAEKKQLAQQHVQQMMDSNPEMKQGMADLHAGKDTPQAKAFQAEVDKAGNAYIREEFAKLRQQNPGAGPQEQGGMLQSVMQGYQNMPEPMKWMMGIGLGGGLLGILGSMFGGGGGMGMLGLLGLGAAGLAGAGGGMFGQGAQNFMADAVSGIGKSMGMVPEKLTDQQKQILLAKDPVAQIKGGGGWATVPSREGAAKQVAAGREQLGQIQMLNSMGGMTPRMLENMGLSPEEAQLAAKNVGTLSSQYADQDSALNQHLRTGEEYSKPTWTNWAKEMGSGLLGMRQKTSVEHGYNLAHQWAKEARCWKGYEPAPGKAPYSENSCRPIGSKKKKKKTEKTAEEVADEWLKKYRARGQKGRWVNTRRGNKAELKVSHN